MSRCRYPDSGENRVIAIVLAVAAIAFVLIATHLVCGAEPSREVVVLCFSQPNCPACVTQKPNWAAFKRANPAVQIVEADTTKFPAASRKWRVATTPTTIIVKADKDGDSIEHRRFFGVVDPRAIREALP